MTLEIKTKVDMVCLYEWGSWCEALTAILVMLDILFGAKTCNLILCYLNNIVYSYKSNGSLISRDMVSPVQSHIELDSHWKHWIGFNSEVSLLVGELSTLEAGVILTVCFHTGFSLSVTTDGEPNAPQRGTSTIFLLME